jgi:type VI protein secretion system component VasK
MDPVTRVVAALAAGAARGAGEAATTAVKDAYQGLKRLVSARFAGRKAAEVALTEHEADPETWRAPLATELVRTAAVDDPRVIEAAQRLMALLDEAGSKAGKYTVDLHGAQGVQVGDRNTQHNRFS